MSLDEAIVACLAACSKDALEPIIKVISLRVILQFDSMRYEVHTGNLQLSSPEPLIDDRRLIDRNIAANST